LAVGYSNGFDSVVADCDVGRLGVELPHLEYCYFLLALCNHVVKYFGGNRGFEMVPVAAKAYLFGRFAVGVDVALLNAVDKFAE
jgi:hypothetical protein